MNRDLTNRITAPLKRLLRHAKRPFDLRTVDALVSHPRGAIFGTALQKAAREDIPAEDLREMEKIEYKRKEDLRDSRPFESCVNGMPLGEYDHGHTMRDIALASKDSRRAGLLYQVVRATAPSVAVELGTNVGVSSAYQGLGMRHRGPSQLHVFDMSPARLHLAKALHQQLPMPRITYHQGTFDDTLAHALASLPPVDYAFVDGHHLYDPSHAYTNLILQHTSPEAVLIFDDIRWNSGMVKFWREIRKDSRFSVVVDLFTFGLARVAAPDRTTPPDVVGPLALFL